MAKRFEFCLRARDDDDLNTRLPFWRQRATPVYTFIITPTSLTCFYYPISLSDLFRVYFCGAFVGRKANLFMLKEGAGLLEEIVRYERYRYYAYYSRTECTTWWCKAYEEWNKETDTFSLTWISHCLCNTITSPHAGFLLSSFLKMKKQPELRQSSVNLYGWRGWKISISLVVRILKRASCKCISDAHRE